MKRFLLPFFIVLFSLNLSHAVETKKKVQMPPTTKSSDCEAKWTNAKKDANGNAMYVVGGFVGVRYLPKTEWMNKCMSKGPLLPGESRP